MTKISILKVVESTTVDGPGLRTSIYCAGCANMCPGCHNPQSWDIESGRLTDIEELLDKVKQEDFCNVTFSGGDPMMQPLAFAELAIRIHAETNKNIWCYTGYTYEQVLADPIKKVLLEQVDVLVDGRFIKALRDENLLFRGSSNQRIIDVKKSLQTGQVTILHPELSLKVVL